MSMTVSGGGSSVPGGGPSIDPINTQQTINTTTTPTPPPTFLYQNLSTTPRTVGTLGIDLPRAPDDVAVLLMEATLKLQETIAVGRSDFAAAFTAVFQNAVNNIQNTFTQIEDLGTQAEQIQTELKTISEELLERVDPSVLVAVIAERFEIDPSQVPDLSNLSPEQLEQVLQLFPQLFPGLRERLNELAGEKGAEIGQLQQELAQAQGSSNPNQSRIAELQAAIAVANAELDELQGQINLCDDGLELFSQQQELLEEVNSLIFSSIFGTFGQVKSDLDTLVSSFAQQALGDDSQVELLFEDISGRLLDNKNRYLEDATRLNFLDPTRLSQVVARIAEARGLNVTPEQIAGVVAALTAGQAVRPTLNGIILDAAIRTLTPDQLRNQDVRGRVVQAAVGLVTGLWDVVTTLGALEALETVNTKEQALSDGMRLRLVV
jgi:hypothetical protein